MKAFGAQNLLNGSQFLSEKYTSLFPHELDACSTIHILIKELGLLKQQSKLNKQNTSKEAMLA